MLRSHIEKFKETKPKARLGSFKLASLITKARARARLLNELEMELELGSSSFNSRSNRDFNESIPSSSRTARLTYTPNTLGTHGSNS
ncbi:hypothetical protein OSB04_017214 [Centaurea solstitialis]|uniref:Uncharacterized protein n=1 Tax=Centaurea solstitialis TaxID=347529 RepID=A0AA38T2H7_9ASTR|nr:hypothetical protein OSB04_017214 [Centaurea solstitialis]